MLQDVLVDGLALPGWEQCLRPVDRPGRGVPSR
jgi:hypothetical protein